MWFACWRARVCPPTWQPKLRLLISCQTSDSYTQMCCKDYHIIFSSFFLKFESKICVQKEVIHFSFKNHILVTWPATNLLILRNGVGLKNQITIILFKKWPNNRFSKAKSNNFHCHKTISHDLLVQMAYNLNNVRGA